MTSLHDVSSLFSASDFYKNEAGICLDVCRDMLAKMRFKLLLILNYGESTLLYLSCSIIMLSLT